MPLTIADVTAAVVRGFAKGELSRAAPVTRRKFGPRATASNGLCG